MQISNRAPEQQQTRLLHVPGLLCSIPSNASVSNAHLSAQYAAVLLVMTLYLAAGTCSPQIRVEMKNYFLQYLDSHALSLESFVAINLVQLLCRTVKLAWFDSDAAKAIVDDCKALMERGR